MKQQESKARREEGANGRRGGRGLGDRGWGARGDLAFCSEEMGTGEGPRLAEGRQVPHAWAMTHSSWQEIRLNPNILGGFQRMRDRIVLIILFFE